MLDPRAFTQWSDRDLLVVHKLITLEGLKSFASLQTEFDIPNIEIFWYLQVKHFLLNLVANRKPNCPSTTWFEDGCLKDPHARGMILSLNGALLQGSSIYASLICS